jgi:Cu2+-exporting ATPase
VEIPPILQTAIDQAAARGQAAILLVEDVAARARALAVFTVADVIRPESREAIQSLHDQRIKVAMLTGDARPGRAGRCQRARNRQRLCGIAPA